MTSLPLRPLNPNRLQVAPCSHSCAAEALRVVPRRTEAARLDLDYSSWRRTVEIYSLLGLPVQILCRRSHFVHPIPMPRRLPHTSNARSTAVVRETHRSEHCCYPRTHHGYGQPSEKTRGYSEAPLGTIRPATFAPIVHRSFGMLSATLYPGSFRECVENPWEVLWACQSPWFPLVDEAGGEGSSDFAARRPYSSATDACSDN
mmetsp:Transcript_1136/g.2683  ORF Transcript_1136/g.2683 Transcript_1136/m.2683 type:complete len:203 (+) Transcript_1136:220-828(+)